jgi:hypothetical protein
VWEEEEGALPGEAHRFDLRDKFDWLEVSTRKLGHLLEGFPKHLMREV